MMDERRGEISGLGARVEPPRGAVAVYTRAARAGYATGNVIRDAARSRSTRARPAPALERADYSCPNTPLTG